MVGQRPFLALDRLLLLFELPVDPRAERQSQQRFLGAGDQRGVGPGRQVDAGVEQRREVALEIFAEWRVAGAGEAVVPVRRHPQLDEFGLPSVGHAEHQVGLQRLIEELRVLQVLGDLLLDPVGQHRHEQVFQATAVGVLGRLAELVTLIEAERQHQRRAFAAMAIAARQVAQRVQRREDVPDAALAGQGGAARLLDGGDLLVGVGDQAGVAGVAAEQDEDEQRRQHRRAAVGAPLKVGAVAVEEAGARDQTGLGKDDVLQQPGEEIADAAAAERRHRLPLQVEGRGDGTDDAVDRRALLGGAGEIDAADEHRLLEARLPERLAEELLQLRFQQVHLLGERHQHAAARQLALLFEARDDPAGQAFQQQIELRREGFQQRVRVLRELQREGGSPHLLALFGGHAAEEIGEAGDEVALGEDDVDRRPHLQALVDLLDPALDGVGVAEPLGGVAADDIGDAEGDQDAIDRPVRPVLAQQIEEVLPGRAVDRRVGVLRRIAAGGVDQHGIVGEEPVAVAGATDAAHRVLAELVDQRELQAGVGERRGLAAARRADDDIPRQLIEQAPPALSPQLRFLQHCQGLAEALARASRALRARPWRTDPPAAPPAAPPVPRPPPGWPCADGTARCH